MKTSHLKCGAISAVAVLAAFGSRELFSADAAATRETSLAYYGQMTKVLQHPRCLNCHPTGNQPLQGMDMHVHIMNVQRGAEDKSGGHGAVGAKCATCHGTENNPSSGVPGAPKWALAPLSMAWVGLSQHALCERLKDPAHNHGMSLQQIVHHNGHDPLVGWAWHPGAGREPAPGTQKDFGDLTQKWVETGAACPD